MADEVWNALESERGRREAHVTNAARRATSYVTFTTRGIGETITPEALEFDAPFIDEPAVAAGFVIAQGPDRTFYRLPRVCAGVFRWQRDERGFHVGAWCYFTVDVPTRLDVDGEPYDLPRAIVEHHLAFTGLAYKRLPDNALDELDDAIEPLPLPAVP